VSEFDKTMLVAKLKAARDRKLAKGQKCGGRKSYAESNPELVALARRLAAGVSSTGQGALLTSSPRSSMRLATK
jgi:hypothetical protein